MPIFPEDQVDENFFDLYYHPYKKQIWGVGIAAATVVVGFLGVRQLRQNRLDEQWTRYEDAISLRASAALPGQTDADRSRRQVDALELVARDYPDDPVTPWALKGIVDAHIAAAKWDDALAGLDELQRRYPEFALNTLPSGGEGSLADHLRATLESEKTWAAAAAYEHPAPAEDRLACIETTLGTFWVGFYPEQAPAHVAGFVERAKRGDYNGTQVYEVRLNTDGSPQVFRAGSLASKTNRDPREHDRDEPADTIEPEDARFTIRHKFGVLSAVDMPSGESATRFQVITARDGMTRYDGETTPFGAVLDREGGLEVVKALGSAPTYGTNPETATAEGLFGLHDHPYPPILIRRVSIWSNEKLEDGHTWDTARAATAESEPWEADLPAAPTPKELSGEDEDPATPPTKESEDEQGADDGE